MDYNFSHEITASKLINELKRKLITRLSYVKLFVSLDQNNYFPNAQAERCIQVQHTILESCDML